MATQGALRPFTLSSAVAHSSHEDANWNLPYERQRWAVWQSHRWKELCL